MSKALVIKGADFTTNALTTITFEDTVDCTGISLNKATSTITSIGGTDTLVATPTPSDTTDRVVWSSSDNLIATVSNGVVTAVGLGTATITATCGNYSATCSVTVRAFMDKSAYILRGFISGDNASTGGNGLPYITVSDNNSSRCSIASLTGELGLYRAIDGIVYYPYSIPTGTKRIKITTPTGNNSLRTDCLAYCSASTPASSSFPTVSMLIGKASWSSLTPTDGVVIVTIPEYDGYPVVDAILIGLRMTNESTTFLESYLDDVEIEFLPAEE